VVPPGALGLVSGFLGLSHTVKQTKDFPVIRFESLPLRLCWDWYLGLAWAGITLWERARGGAQGRETQGIESDLEGFLCDTFKKGV
jgi:hypothetical protein